MERQVKERRKGMNGQRIDTWTEQENQLLVNTLLNYVRDGKTQLQAFEDVGEKIDRSACACGFRWNKYLRQNYTQALKHARRIRRGQPLKKPDAPTSDSKKITH
jgi:prespore-specific regulator